MTGGDLGLPLFQTTFTGDASKIVFPKNRLLRRYYLNLILTVWQNVQKWLNQIEFKDFVNGEPENEQRTQKRNFDDDEIIHFVCTEKTPH